MSLTRGKDLSRALVKISGTAFLMSTFSISQVPADTAVQNFKRAVGRRQDRCPAGLIFHESECLGGINPQLYRVICIEPFTNATSAHVGRCRFDELCVDWEDDPGDAGPLSRAYCVGLRSLMSWGAPKLKRTVESIGAGQAGLPAGRARGYRVEAVMTGLDVRESVKASTIQIEAQRSVVVHGSRLWTTLPAGTSQCSDCGTVELLVPKGTQRLLVSVAMATVAGFVHLGAFRS